MILVDQKTLARFARRVFNSSSVAFLTWRIAAVIRRSASVAILPFGQACAAGRARFAAAWLSCEAALSLDEGDGAAAGGFAVAMCV